MLKKRMGVYVVSKKDLEKISEIFGPVPMYIDTYGMCGMIVWECQGRRIGLCLSQKVSLRHIWDLDRLRHHH